MKNVPEIRFRGFDGEWEEDKIGNLFDIFAGGDISKEHLKDISNDIYRYPVYANTLVNKGLHGYSDIYKFDGETITVTGRGANTGVANARYNKYYPIVRLLVLCPKEKCNIKFFEEVINNSKIFIESTGVPQLTGPQISKVKVKFPLNEEQERIASFLTKVDKLIEMQDEKVKNYELYKKGMMQKIFYQEIRFRGDRGEEYPKWEERKLNKLLYENKERNYENKYSKDDVLSVSGEYGIVNQIKFLGRSYAGESVENYHVVHTGDIVYTKSPLKSNPYGIIKVNKGLEGIVSTLYAVYSCKEIANGKYLDYYFQLDDNTNKYIRPLVNKGAKNDMKINNEYFLTDKIMVPSIKEQERIVRFFEAIDRVLDKEKEKLGELRKWKKGLLQGMFV